MGAGFSLAVLRLDGETVHRLPSSGRVTVGRAHDCDVVVDDVSVSRRHAEIDLGPPPTIRDLGSANGTRVRRHTSSPETAQLFDSRLERDAREPLRPGVPVSIGSVLLCLRERTEEEGAAPVSTSTPGLVVKSPDMVKAYELTQRVARGHISVLFLGETGVGKEVFAEALHRASPRAAGPFVAVNCGALPETIAESELFGHEKGAFTGAVAPKEGLFEATDGGTVFLDEVAELSPALQVKLLRVLEDKKVQRLGAVSPRSVDVRIVAATHADLADRARSGAFRQDLYFRLNGITVTIPPLRERKIEIRDLAQLFAARAAWAMGQAPPSFSPAALARLEEHDWPGNVRELRNVVERAVVLARDATIVPEDLHLDGGAPTASAPRETPTAAGTLRAQMDDVEKQKIIDALERTGGNQTKAAIDLGISRRTLVAKIAEYGIRRERRK